MFLDLVFEYLVVTARDNSQGFHSPLGLVDIENESDLVWPKWTKLDLLLNAWTSN